MIGSIIAGVIATALTVLFMWAVRTNKNCPYLYEVSVCGDCSLGYNTDYKYCFGLCKTREEEKNGEQQQFLPADWEV